MALSRPTEALATALATLSTSPPPRSASIAHQAAGIVLRDFGDIDEAITHLRSAVRFARLAGDAEREADVRGSLGAALVMAGQPRRGLRWSTRRSERQQRGRRGPFPDPARARVVAARPLRRDAARRPPGGRPAARHRRAGLAGQGLQPPGDGPHRDGRRRPRRRRLRPLRDALHPHRPAAGAGHRASRNGARPRSPAATCPRARLLRRRQLRRVDELAVFEPELHVNKCAVLLAAGLPREALAEADGAVARIEELRGSATRRAELLHSAALAAYGCGALGRRRAPLPGRAAAVPPAEAPAVGRPNRTPARAVPDGGRATARPPCWAGPGGSPRSWTS